MSFHCLYGNIISIMSYINQSTTKLIFSFFICLCFFSKVQAQGVVFKERKSIQYYRSIWVDAGAGLAGGIGVAAQYNINIEFANNWFISIGQIFLDEGFVKAERTVDYHDLTSTSYRVGKV